MDEAQRRAVRAGLRQWLDRLEREARSQVAQVEPRDCHALSELLRAELTGTLPPSAGAGSFLPAPGTSPLPDASEPGAGEPSAVRDPNPQTRR